jgi:hypothetical protein
MAWPMDAKAKITGHYMLYWRVPTNVHVQKQPGLPDTAVIEYAPNANRQGWLLATNGASNYRVRQQGKQIGCELFGRFRDKAAWNLELFAAICRYVVTQRTPLFTFDTISLDGLSAVGQMPFPHLLFGEGLYQPETLGSIQFDAQNIIIVNQVYGLYDAELEYAKQYGGEALWNKMRASNMPDALDVNRPHLI